MSKDISTMFTKEEKRMEELGTDRLPERKILSSVRHSMERFCRKEVRKDD